MRRCQAAHSSIVTARIQEFESFKCSREEVINDGKEAAEKAHNEMKELYKKIPESWSLLEGYRKSLDERAYVQNSYFNARKTLYQDYFEKLKVLKDEHIPINPMNAFHNTIKTIKDNETMSAEEKMLAIHKVIQEVAGDTEAVYIANVAMEGK